MSTFTLRSIGCRCSSKTFATFFLGNGPEGDKVLWNTGDFCLLVCLSPQTLSGLKSALSDSRPERADIRPERGWGDGQMDIRSPVFFIVIEILFTSSVTLLHR